MRTLLEQDYKNLNIIVIQISNSAKPDYGVGRSQFNNSQHISKLRNQVQHGVSRGDFSESRVDADKSGLNGNSGELDIVTKNLNRLARQTPEGYMIIIEQRQFEGRENVHAAIGGNNNTTIVNKSALTNDATGIAYGSHARNGLSKDVEKVFHRIC